MILRQLASRCGTGGIRFVRAPSASLAGRRLLATQADADDIRANDAALEEHLRRAVAAQDAGEAPVGVSSQQEMSLGSSPSPQAEGGPPSISAVEAWRSFQHIRNTTAGYGSQLSPHYHPRTLLSNPPRVSDVTLELLLASQAHLGHSTSIWDPGNSRYIFGVRQGIHIISLDATAQHLRRAAKVVSRVAEMGGFVLFVGTRPGFAPCVVKAAQLASPAYHVFERWTPGAITNANQILGKCQTKVVDEHDREVNGFEAQLAERASLKPDLVICLNPLENTVLLQECAISNIPTIAIIDTDANPSWVTYPIPANDDSIRCVQVIAGVLGRAGQEGQRKRRADAREGRINHLSNASLKMPEGFSIADHEAKNREARENEEPPLTEDEPVTAETYQVLEGVQQKLNADEIHALREGMHPAKIPAIEDRVTPTELATLEKQFNATLDPDSLNRPETAPPEPQSETQDMEQLYASVEAKLSEQELTRLSEGPAPEELAQIRGKLTEREWAALLIELNASEVASAEDAAEMEVEGVDEVEDAMDDLGSPDARRKPPR